MPNSSARRLPRPVAILAVAAAAADAFFFAWIFAARGTLGLALWAWGPRLAALAAVGLAGPLLAAAAFAAAPRSAAAPSGFRRAARLAASVLSGTASSLAFLVYAALAIGLAVVGRPAGTQASDGRPPLALVDRAAGVATAEPGVVRLSLSSDPHWGRAESDAEARAAVIASAASALPRRDAFVLLGDAVEVGSVEAQWAEARRGLAALDGLPLLALMGNHDAIVRGEGLFMRSFMPEGAAAARASGSPSPHCYALDAGPLRLVVLDLLWGDEDWDGRRAAWLEKTLESTPADKQVVVLSHCFFYSSGYVDEESGKAWYDHPGTTARIAPALEKHGVDLVVSGHNHYMELLEKGGTTYAVVGAMGGKPDPAPTYRSPHSVWFRRGGFGRLDLDADARGIELVFRDEAGAELHRAFLPARP